MLIECPTGSALTVCWDLKKLWDWWAVRRELFCSQVPIHSSCTSLPTMETLRQTNNKYYSPWIHQNPQEWKGCLGMKATGRHTQIPFRIKSGWVRSYYREPDHPTSYPNPSHHHPPPPPPPHAPTARQAHLHFVSTALPSLLTMGSHTGLHSHSLVEIEIWPLVVAHLWPQFLLIQRWEGKSGGRRVGMQGRDKQQHWVWLKLASSIFSRFSPVPLLHGL